METDIERLKAFHQIESFLDNETKELLIDKLNLENTDLDRRLSGLKIEDEFALILHFFNNCKHIISLDETTSELTDESYQSDFIVHFKNNKKMMIEVKSKVDSKFKISKNNFEKRKEFAYDLGYELYFALKLRGYWMLFHSDYLVENNFRIELEKDMNNSILLTEFDCGLYIIPQGIRIETIYSLKEKGGLGIKHGLYGELISYTLFYQDKLIFEVSSENMEHLPECLVFELWHDSLLEGSICEQIDNMTVKLIEETKDELLTLDFRYYLSSISHMVNYNDGGRYGSSSFLKLLASKEDIALTKYRLEVLLNKLVDLGIPIIFSKYISNDTIIYKRKNNE